MISFVFRRSFVTLLWSLLIAFGAGCAAGPAPERAPREGWSEPQAGTQSECLPRFPDRAGWYGGDAAYSVPLPIDDERSSVWLFGDSFVRRPEAGDSRAYPFIHNSIGISHCAVGGIWRMETFWKHDDRGRPRAFFEPDANAPWVQRARGHSDVEPYYWPLDGFVLDDVLFVALLRVVHEEPRGPYNLPFRFAGTDLVRIVNFRDDPEHWLVRSSTLSNDREAFPGTSFVLTPEHLYAFAFVDDERGRSPRILSRLPREALEGWQTDLSDALETLTVGGSWKRGFAPRDAAILMEDDASEMSVHFDAQSGEWMAVYSDLAPRTEPDSTIAIRIRTAPDLVGPWSAPETLVEIPESRPDDPRSRDANLFCYAGKAHPQFSTPTRILVTYVCNLFAREPENGLAILERLRERSDLYRPRALRLPVP